MPSPIGYLIPEFPGQTHTWIWRERQALNKLGIETVLVSTRRPLKAIMSQTWANEAENQTHYLAPFVGKDWLAAIAILLQAGPKGWLRCLEMIYNAADLSWGQRGRLIAMMLMAAKLIHLSKCKGFTHIHVHSCGDAANIALLASLLSKLTYSLSQLAPSLLEYGPNQAQKWSHATFAVVMSHKLLDEAKDLLGNALPEVIAVAPVGVNVDQMKRQIPYQPTTDGVWNIFCCGRLNPIKGHADLIQAIAILQQRGFNVQLNIAGEDEQGGRGYRQVLERIIQEQSLTESIQLLGAASESRCRQELENAHLFALASHNEGIPVAVMEAMAMEVPVVVTNVGGISELIDPATDGILVPSEHPEAMADAIARILQDSDLAHRLSQASRQKVATKFNHRRGAEILATCLQSGAIEDQNKFSTQPQI